MILLVRSRLNIIVQFALICTSSLPLHADEPQNPNAAAGPAPTSQNADEFQSIRGVVTTQDGTPIAKAKITLGTIKRIPILAVTDEAGKFEATNIPKDRTILTPVVTHPDFVSLSSFQCPLDKDRSTEVTWQMKRGGKVHGRVIAKSDGRPLKNITIIEGRSRFGSNRVEPKTKTDDDGKFELGCIEPGACVINAFSPKFAPSMQEVIVDVDHSANIEFQIEEGKDVTGRVTDPSGKPIAKVWIITDAWNGIRMLRRETHTDNDGNYTLRQMPATPAIVHVLLEDYISVRDLSVVGGDRKDIVLHPMIAYSIKLRLSDTDRIPEKPVIQSGYLLPGRKDINWSNQSYRSTYDAKSGVVSIREDEPIHGKKSYRFRVEGYQDAFFNVPAEPTAATSLELTLERAKVTTGRVVDADTGGPVEGVMVALVNDADRLGLDHYIEFGHMEQAIEGFTGIHSITDKEGKFDLAAIEPTTDRTLVLCKLKQSFFVAGPAKDFAGSDSLEIPFPKGGAIESSVSIAGTPRPGETIKLALVPMLSKSSSFQPPFGFGGELTTGQDGTCRFDGLGPGRYRMNRVKSFHEPGGGGISHYLSSSIGNVVILPGQTAKFDFIQPSGKSIRGKVLEADGQGSGNCVVTLQQLKPFESLQRVDAVRAGATGEFTFEHVAPGDYQLVAEHYTRSGNGAMCGLGNNDQTGQVMVSVAEDAEAVIHLKPKGLQSNSSGTKLKGVICPEFAGDLLDGSKPVRLSESMGKVVVIDFWATWCGPCMAVMPEVKRIYEKYKGRDDVVFLTVSLDEDESQLRKVCKEKGLEFPICFTGDGWRDSIAQMFGVRAIPCSFVIAPNGRFAAEQLQGSRLEESIETALRDWKSSPPADQSLSSRVSIKTTLDGEKRGLPGAKIELRVTGADGETMHQESIPVLGTASEFVYATGPRTEGSRIHLAGSMDEAKSKETELPFDKDQIEAVVAFESPRILSGHVTKSEENAEIAGLEIEARRNDSFIRTATTDADGKFSMRVLPGQYFLSFKNKNQTTMVATEKKEPLTVANDHDLSDVELQACTLTALEGDVVDEEGHPVIDAAIYSASNQTKERLKTDAQGHFKMPAVPSRGTIVVSAHKGRTQGGAQVDDRMSHPKIVLTRRSYLTDVRAGERAVKLSLISIEDVKEIAWRAGNDRNSLVLFCPLWHPRSKEWIATAQSWSTGHDTTLVVVSIDQSAESARKRAEQLGLGIVVGYVDPFGLRAADDWNLTSPGQSYLISATGMFLAIQEPGKFAAPPVPPMSN